jgi:hypothetical protein
MEKEKAIEPIRQELREVERKLLAVGEEKLDLMA